MRPRMRAVLSMLLLAAFAISACSQNTGTQQPTSAVAPAIDATAAAPATEATSAASGLEATVAPAANATAAAGGTTSAASGFPLNPNVSGKVELWHFWSSPVRRTAIQRVISICRSKLPNIEITETPKPFGDIWTANIAAVAAGSGMPDVIVEDRQQIAQRAADSVDIDLSQYAFRDGVDGSQFWPFTWNEATVDGKPYGIPFETDVRVLYWNKQAFQEVGLDPEKPPKTWEELEAYADKLDKKNPDGTYARIGFHPDLGNGGWNVWARTNGAELIKDGKPSPSDPKLIETFDWIKKWYDRYGGYDALQAFKSTFGSPPNDAFMSGKVAMIMDINGYSSVLNFYDPRVDVAKADGSTEKQRLGVGIGDLPYSSSYGKTASWSGGFALSIPRGSPNADAAWEFIKCASGPDGAASWSRDTFAMAANLQAAQDPALVGDPRWQFFLNAMKYSQGTTVVPAYTNWGTEIEQRREAIFKGETTAQAAMQEAQQVIDSELGQ